MRKPLRKKKTPNVGQVTEEDLKEAAINAAYANAPQCAEVFSEERYKWLERCAEETRRQLDNIPSFLVEYFSQPQGSYSSVEWLAQIKKILEEHVQIIDLRISQKL